MMALDVMSARYNDKISQLVCGKRLTSVLISKEKYVPLICDVTAAKGKHFSKRKTCD
jgi:hypothetical protein